MDVRYTKLSDGNVEQGLLSNFLRPGRPDWWTDKYLTGIRYSTPQTKVHDSAEPKYFTGFVEW